MYSTRDGGVSDGKHANFNLSHMVDDDEMAVSENRIRFQFGLKGQPQCAWLSQVHSNVVVAAHEVVNSDQVEADAAWTDQDGIACVALAADCMPVLFASDDGSRVAAAHAGWRGLAAGVIDAVAETFMPGQYSAYIGPCISQEHYCVDKDVKDQLLAAGASDAAFKPGDKGKHNVDLVAIARQRLLANHAREVRGAGLCTYSERKLFFSARRDGRQSGRFVCAIWKAPAVQQRRQPAVSIN